MMRYTKQCTNSKIIFVGPMADNTYWEFVYITFFLLSIHLSTHVIQTSMHDFPNVSIPKSTTRCTLQSLERLYIIYSNNALEYGSKSTTYPDQVRKINPRKIMCWFIKGGNWHVIHLLTSPRIQYWTSLTNQYMKGDNPCTTTTDGEITHHWQVSVIQN